MSRIKVSELGEKVMFGIQENTKVLFHVFIVIALSCAAALAKSGESQPEPQPVQGIRIVRSNVHHDVSLPLRDMIRMHNELAASSQEEEAEPLRLIPLPVGLKPAGDPDPVLQSVTNSPTSGQAPTAGLAFDGLGNG